MSPALWLLAGLAAAAVAAWAYGAREERVPGRSGPAALRALVLFLILGGLALPALRGGPLEAPTRVALLDVSRSMSLPARPAADAPARLDSARAALAALAPERVLAFGAAVRPVRLDSVAGLRADEDRSRLAPAIEAAALGGADSVWLFTDGDLGDRAEALRLAGDLGLGVREIRVAEPVARVGLAALRVPESARAGDTILAAVEVRAGGDVSRLPDSVSIELRLDGETVGRARAPLPGPGRAGRVEIPLVPSGPEEGSAWRRYEAALTDPADPLGASDRASAWVEVSEAGGGAVFVSTRPDWEARFLVPALERAVLGGGRGFLRLSDGRWLEVSPRPRLVEEVVVRRALPGSRLLVVQGAPAELPPWLASALAAHPRSLVLVEGAGEIPGSGVRVSGPLPGEWYPTGPVPPSPAAPLLRESDLDELPPAREVYALDGRERWTVLSAARDRRGESRPLLIAGDEGARRWAASATTEWWRWALREGAPRRVYDGAFSGLVGWLVEDASPRLAGLASAPAAGEPLLWRVRPGARELTATVLDASGAEVWSRSWDAPGSTVGGPTLPPGRYEVRLEATGPEGPFASTRPVEIVPDPAELLAGPLTEPAVLAASRPPRDAADARAPRPVWPFALAIVLLCAEWIWRHRIGLR